MGAGHNGLVAACYLAKSGLKTLALERNASVGGACVTNEPWPGYRVSTGAYLCSLLRREIIDDLDLENNGLHVYRRMVAGFLPLEDGRHLFLGANGAAMRTEMLRVAPDDAVAYEQFIADADLAAGIVAARSLGDPPGEAGLQRDFEAAGRPELFEQFVAGSVGDLMRERFGSEALKALLTTDGLIGSSIGPNQRGSAYVLTYHYMGEALGERGAWGYVTGGMGSVTESLARVFESYGGHMRVSSPVREIFAEHANRDDNTPHSAGVMLESGERIGAQIVVCNADPQAVHNAIGGAGGEAARKLLAAWDQSDRGRTGYSAKINLAVSELPRFASLPPGDRNPGPEHLGTIHFCTSIDQMHQAWSDAMCGKPSHEPMIEMYIQTATDRTLSPPGKHILSLFVQYFPYNLRPHLDPQAEKERFTLRVIDIIARHAPNVPASILHRETLTPRDIESRFGITGGHIFHRDLAPTAPGPRTGIGGLYMCGSASHPGGCVSGAPGLNASRAVIADLGGQHGSRPVG